MPRERATIRVTGAPGARAGAFGVAGQFIQPTNPFEGRTVLELVESGLIPKTPTAYARRTVAPGMLQIESMAGGVLAALDGGLTPSGGELSVTVVTLDGVGERITDGARTLRRLEATIELDGLQGSVDVGPSFDMLEAIRRVGLPVRVYGITPWPQLVWRFEALEWDDADDGMIWDESGRLVFAAADIVLVENLPADLLNVRSVKPGAAAREAERRAASNERARTVGSFTAGRADGVG